MIRNALIIEDNGDNNVVQIGKTVTYHRAPGDEEESYQIVGSAEAEMPLKVKFLMNLQWQMRLLVKV